MAWLVQLLGELVKYLAPWLIKKVSDVVEDQLTESEREKKLKAAEEKYDAVMANPNSTQAEKEKAHADFVNAARS